MSCERSARSVSAVACLPAATTAVCVSSQLSATSRNAAAARSSASSRSRAVGRPRSDAVAVKPLSASRTASSQADSRDTQRRTAPSEAPTADSARSAFVRAASTCVCRGRLSRSRSIWPRRSASAASPASLPAIVASRVSTWAVSSAMRRCRERSRAVAPMCSASGLAQLPVAFPSRHRPSAPIAAPCPSGSASPYAICDSRRRTCPAGTDEPHHRGLGVRAIGERVEIIEHQLGAAGRPMAQLFPQGTQDYLKGPKGFGAECCRTGQLGSGLFELLLGVATLLHGCVVAVESTPDVGDLLLPVAYRRAQHGARRLLVLRVQERGDLCVRTRDTCAVCCPVGVLLGRVGRRGHLRHGLLRGRRLIGVVLRGTRLRIGVPPQVPGGALPFGYPLAELVELPALLVFVSSGQAVDLALQLLHGGLERGPPLLGLGVLGDGLLVLLIGQACRPGQDGQLRRRGDQRGR